MEFEAPGPKLSGAFSFPVRGGRTSSRCEGCQGRSPPLSELQDIVGEADEAPLGGGLLDAAQQELAEAARLLDLSEHRLGQLLAQAIGLAWPPALIYSRMATTRAPPPSPSPACLARPGAIEASISRCSIAARLASEQ
jgi:hypothetical protein